MSDTETKVAKKKISKPKQPPRPHRRMQQETLTRRIEDIKHKLKLSDSKTVILRDRLDSLEKENDLRMGEVKTEPEAE